MRPESEADVASVIRSARESLSIAGGATRLRPGEGQGARLDMRGLTGVVLYEPEALTLVVRAGTPLDEVATVLKAENQMLGFEPDHRPGSTIGGVVAANASGPRRVLVNACRDALIGVRFVDGAGEVIKNGGRVMKNVTGYDLVKLMAGSRGRLGALTEVAFKTTPIPPSRATLRLSGLNAAQAVEAMTVALGGPFDVSGAGILPTGETVLRLEGLAGSVEARAATLVTRLARFGDVETVEGDADFAALRDAGAAMAAQAGKGAVWRIVLRPSQAGALIATLPGRLAVDWGGALIWAEAPDAWRPDLPTGAIAERVAGAAPLHLPAMAPAIAALNDGVARRFDPRGLFGSSARGVAA
ncbi:FAD-binding protein [Paracoccus sp. TK19116]|uniref:FAD-binding protein n=1 Tax=Paracoccus albicereus TaxID=2922394 RepID=A0ABT1MPQ6_9RHOB|nr:FAD-binding protein [Paracoccus albicereus]MCQ0970282.1 FAD-binding protein [Paracoccus albicereus]